MVRSKAITVEQYLKGLPRERREVVSAVREAIRKRLPKGYDETIGWGIISYEIPLSRYPRTYNGRPLCYAGLAAQKNHYALYLMCVYADAESEAKLREGFRQAGKKLDMGKSCLRFKKLEDIPLDVIGDVIASTPPEEYIEKYEQSRRRS